MRSITVNGVLIEVVEGDITHEDVDAIVNAANRSLLGGSGVDSAIHYAAGPQLLEECRALNGCGTGDAKITKGYRLKARHVIHTVGPIYRDGDHGEPDDLASCYRRSLEVALANDLTSVAFPAVSCGVYGYPARDAARIAAETVVKFVKEHPGLKRVRFVMYGGKMTETMDHALDAVKSGGA